MALSESLSPSSITIVSESFLNVEQLLRTLRMWCDAPESMTHFGAAAAKAQPVSQKALHSPVIARVAVAVAFISRHHSFICV